jgi:hypothetical protein
MGPSFIFPFCIRTREKTPGRPLSTSGDSPGQREKQSQTEFFFEPFHLDAINDRLLRDGKEIRLR